MTTSFLFLYSKSSYYYVRVLKKERISKNLFLLPVLWNIVDRRFTFTTGLNAKNANIYYFSVIYKPLSDR